jgi:aryl-alcohol dehydrogenase-like predicted oxidoreductase
MPPESTLPGGEVTSALGFGCSALLGGRSRRAARYLLDAAFDSGIRHFDVARVYGTGDAEAVVGEFAAGRRERLTIATKFGIDPAAPGAASGAAKRLVRFATRRSRRALALARRHSGRTVRRGAFEPRKARSSLAVSLAQLRTDRVDAYLLHDCTAAEWSRPSLLEELRELLAAGSIGCFGPATSALHAAAILAAGGPPPRIAQFEVELAPPGPAPVVPAGITVVHHGIFSRGFASLRGWLADPERIAEWSAELDLDAGSPLVLGDLMLAAALRRNRGGIVLVSASSAERIRRNAACAESRPFADDQLDTFAALLRTVGRPSPRSGAAR